MKSVSAEQRLQVAFVRAGRYQSLKRIILTWYSHVLRDPFYPESNILIFVRVPIIASNGVFSLLLIIIITITMRKSLSHGVGCQQAS